MISQTVDRAEATGQLKIVMIPKNHEYVRTLSSTLRRQGVSVEILKPFHYSAPTNILKIIYLRLQGFRIVHIHWLYIFPFTFVMKLFHSFCRFLGIRVVWEMHNIVAHGFRRSDKKRAKWFYEKVDAVVFHSESDIVRSRELLGTDTAKEHFAIIPHGSFNDSYSNHITKAQARRILKVDSDVKIILCFGFIRRNRGYEYLLEAAKGLNDTMVLIAGKILERDVYKMLLNYEERMPNLKLLAGWIDDENLQVLFNACDIVVLPYTEITTSGVIPLAYGFMRPVITSNIGGLKDVVRENTGILVPPRDSDSLRNAIRVLFEMDYEEMGRQAYNYASNAFCWQRNVRTLSNLYASLLG